MKTVLALERVSYAYEDAPFALREVSLTIREGERIAVLGPNGAGKSTFFLVCNGVFAPTEGRVLLEGTPVLPRKKDLLRLREKVGIVFQDPNQQLIGATVEAELSFGPMNLRLSKEEVSARVEDAITLMRLEKLRTRPPHALSGGEKKRVTVADVLAMEPRVFLLDEPTAFLDHQGALLLERQLDRLGERGHSLLVSTHDVDFAWRWADRALVFFEGRLLADGPSEQIFADSALLQAARLPSPLLWSVAEAMRLDARPKTVEELEVLLHPVERCQ